MADTKPSRLYIIITGANSGVGLGIATRLLAQLSLPARQQPTDSLTQSYPFALPSSSSSASPRELDTPCPFYPNAGVTLILACRSEERALGARSMLLSGLKKDFERRGEVRNREGEEEFMKGLEIVWEKLDLGDMRSVMAFNGKVLETYPYITHLFLNAGVGAWSAIYWPDAFLETLTDPIGALTNPRFKKQEAGWKTEKDGLGWVWQCSVFGHWCIAKALLPLLTSSNPFPSPRIIWTSSHLSHADPSSTHIDFSDVQCIATSKSYEQTKRQIDVLGSELDRELQSMGSGAGGRSGRSLVCDPAVTATEIYRAQLKYGLYECMMLAFYFVRFVLNSQNHPISLLSGTIAFVHVALLPSLLIPAPKPTNPSSSASSPPSSSSSTSTTSPLPVSSSSSLRAAYKFRSQADRWGRAYVSTAPITYSEEEGSKIVEVLEEMREKWEGAVGRGSIRDGGEKSRQRDMYLSRDL